jgi:microcompartment protein CcmL/EutN
MALGMIEVYGFTTAIVVADAAAKAAEVEVVALDRNKPANGDAARVPLVIVVKLEGSAAAVEAAMEAGIAEAKARDLYITSDLIAGQSPEIEWFARLNALGRDKLRDNGKSQDETLSTETSVKEI